MVLDKECIPISNNFILEAKIQGWKGVILKMYSHHVLYKHASFLICNLVCFTTASSLLLNLGYRL